MTYEIGQVVEVLEWNKQWVRGRVLKVECWTTPGVVNVIEARVPPIAPDKPLTCTIRRGPEDVRPVSVLDLMADASKLGVGDRVWYGVVPDRTMGGPAIGRRCGTVLRLEELEDSRVRALVRFDRAELAVAPGVTLALSPALRWCWVDDLEVSLLDTLAHAASEESSGQEEDLHQEDGEEDQVEDGWLGRLEEALEEDQDQYTDWA